MFRNKRISNANSHTDSPPTSKQIFEREVEQKSIFEALLFGFRHLPEDRTWLFQELMNHYPTGANSDQNELHLAMGVYLLNTGAFESALIEFKKVSFDFLRDFAAQDFLQCLNKNNLRPGFQKTLKLFIETAPSLESELVDYLIREFPNSVLRELIAQKTFSKTGEQVIQTAIENRQVQVKENEILLLESGTFSKSSDSTSFDAWLQLAGISAALSQAKFRTRRIPNKFEVTKSNHSNWILISGELTGDSFEIGENLRPIFLGIRITDEKILNARNLSMLQKSSPVICLDKATSQLLSFYEVPNFTLGVFANSLNIKVRSKVGKKVWLDINQWAPKEVLNLKSYELDLDYSKTDFGSKIVKKFLIDVFSGDELKTSNLAAATFAKLNQKPIELKPPSRLRAATDWPVDVQQELEKQIRVIECFKKSNTATELMQNLRVEFQIEIENTKIDFEASAELPNSSIPTSAVTMLLEHKVSIGNAEPSGRHLHIAFGFDQNLVPYFRPVLAQLSEHGSFTADIHVLARGFSASTLEPLAQEFSKFNFHFYGFDKVDYGPNINTLEHITVSTMDRLFLPDLLPEVESVVYLDTDLAVLSDLWEIGNLRLGNNALAARPITTEVWGSGWKTFQKAAGKLPSQTANEVRRALLQHHRLLQTRFVNAGVLVMNLQLMREEEFTKNFLGLIEHARLNDQDLLSIYARGRILELATEWNYTPAQVEICKPKIVHWAGPKKPWKSEYVWLKNVFQKYL